ncbi:Rv1733c family protein [Nocardia jejuensis]|uniref:Rv1733c family protein n=1 Tax=Nocardia jejuensis TaxID=328049 RepID=UPI0012F8CB35|nr:hypothetical protein [Nocardia jejuensis]
MRTSLPMRLWQARPWNTSPLMRVSDRFEVVVRALAVLLAAIAIPMAGAIGTVSYTGAVDRITAQDAGKSHITATVTADAQRMLESDRMRVPPDRYQAPVEWVVDGRTETAVVEVTGPQVPGAAVPLWIGKDGRPTAEPARPGSAAAEGIGTGIAILIECWCAAAAAVWITASVLDARRNAHWEREWKSINRPIGKDSQ